MPKTLELSKELIDKSNKLLEDIEKDLYDYKPEVDRKNKPRDIIKKVIVELRAVSPFKEKYSFGSEN